MTEHVIVPHEAFGPVRFGMTVAEVEAVMGPPDSIKRHDPRYPQHHYRRFGRVGFKAEDGLCKWVESFPNEVEAVVDGIPLAGGFKWVAAALAAAGHEVEGGLEVLDCPSLGVGLWREDPDDDRMGSVTAWAPGYKPGAELFL